MLAVLCVGGQFAVVKLYQAKVGNGLITSLLFSLFSGIIASILFFCFCGFKVAVNLFAFLTATGGILCIVGYTVIGMKMMSIGRITVYTMFLMLGGMFVPFLYGVIFLGEPITFLKIAGIALLVVALLLPVFKKNEEKNSNIKLFTILGIVVFLLNGMVGVFNKIHQVSPNAISTFEFCYWQNSISVIIISAVLPVCALSKKEMGMVFANTKKAVQVWWLIFLFAVASQAGGILQLFAAKTIEASVMFPIVTGGVMVITALFGAIFFKEKIDLNICISLFLSIISTVLFIL